VKVKGLAKGFAKRFYANRVMKSDTNFTRGEYSKLIQRFNHFTGGPVILVKKLMRFHNE